MLKLQLNSQIQRKQDKQIATKMGTLIFCSPYAELLRYVAGSSFTSMIGISWYICKYTYICIYHIPISFQKKITSATSFLILTSSTQTIQQSIYGICCYASWKTILCEPHGRIKLGHWVILNFFPTHAASLNLKVRCGNSDPIFFRVRKWGLE